MAISPLTVVKLIYDIRDVDLGRIFRNLLLHELDELVSGPCTAIQVIHASTLTISDIASSQFALLDHFV